MSCCQFSHKLWTQKTFNRNWGQTLINRFPIPCFSQEKSNNKTLIFFLYSSWYFPFDSVPKTYGGTAFQFLLDLFTMEVNWAPAQGNGWQLGGETFQLYPSLSHLHSLVLAEKASSTGCIVLGKVIQGSWKGRSGWRWFASRDHGNEALKIGTSPPGHCPTSEDTSQTGAASQEIRCNCWAGSLGILADGNGKLLCRGSRADVNDLLPWPAHGQ